MASDKPDGQPITDSQSKPVEKVDGQAASSSKLLSEAGGASDQKAAFQADLEKKGSASSNLPDVSVEAASVNAGSLNADASAAQTPDFGGATEVVKDANGNEKNVPLSKLDVGDHTVKMKDGREFLIHVPQNDGKTPLPTLFVFSGSAHGQFDIKNFAPESGFNKLADGTSASPGEEPSHKFIAVYPLPLKHQPMYTKACPILSLW